MRITTISLLLVASASYNDSVAADAVGSSDGKPAIVTLREFMTTMQSHTTLKARQQGQTPSPQADPLSSYETWLPHTTQPNISGPEKALLKAYLNNPNDVPLAQLLALHHLSQARVDEQRGGQRGRVLRHKIIAQYFLNRAKDLGGTAAWIAQHREKNQRDLDAVFGQAGTITLDEDRSAHTFFRETFHFKEANRYIATDQLLDEFVNDPNNVYTAFANTAVNLWVGSEADYDDPTVLYNFAVGSYLSNHTMKLAQNLETAWNNDPANNTRFRMSTILGGFSLLQRRWFAKLHGDQQAVQLIDDEHRAWRQVHRAFHAFTLGLPFFEEPQNFLEGKAAWEDGFAHCQESGVRTCSDLPRFPYNALSYVLGYVDFLLKNGDIQTATQVLGVRYAQLAEPYVAAPVDESVVYGYWDLGRAPFEHRENDLAAISALYQNGDPTASPMNFLMKKRKWGMNTTTCQVCHQTQSQPFTPDQMAAIQLPPESEASVGTWPQITTTWYGAVLAQ
jgi:hypothetical protein